MGKDDGWEGWQNGSLSVAPNEEWAVVASSTAIVKRARNIHFTLPDKRCLSGWYRQQHWKGGKEGRIEGGWREEVCNTYGSRWEAAFLA